MSRKKPLVDNYPRGTIYRGKEKIKGIRIELGTNHILFVDPDTSRTIMIPLAKLDHISYDTIPQAVIDMRIKNEKEQNERANTTQDNSNRE